MYGAYWYRPPADSSLRTHVSIILVLPSSDATFVSVDLVTATLRRSRDNDSFSIPDQITALGDLLFIAAMHPTLQAKSFTLDIHIVTAV